MRDGPGIGDLERGMPVEFLVLGFGGADAASLPNSLDLHLAGGRSPFIGGLGSTLPSLDVSSKTKTPLLSVTFVVVGECGGGGVRQTSFLGCFEAGGSIKSSSPTSLFDVSSTRGNT